MPTDVERYLSTMSTDPAGLDTNALRATMTHQASAPNPAKPTLDTLQAFGAGGLQGVANLRGIGTPEWSRQLGAKLSSPEANAALGVVGPMKGASSAIRNAAEIMKHQQGGISTTFIGDIKALLKESGMTDKQVDEAILNEARSGRATLARSSSTKITDQQKNGGLVIEGDEPYHTVTFNPHSSELLPSRIDFSSAGAVRGTPKTQLEPAKSIAPLTPEEKAAMKAEFDAVVKRIEAKQGKPKGLSDMPVDLADTERISFSSGGAKKTAAMPLQSVIGRVRDAFYKVAGNPPQDSVRLNVLRDLLKDIPREKIDEALLAMKKEGKTLLMNLDNPRDIQKVGDAALKSGHNTYHTMWIEK
jgi:hypothetical protein